MTETREYRAPEEPWIARVRRQVSRARWRLRTTSVRSRTSGPSLMIGGRTQLQIGPSARVVNHGGVFLEPDAALIVQGQLTFRGPAYLGRGFHLTCFSEVTIGEEFRCGERVSFHDENHRFGDVDSETRQDGYTVAPITIGDRVWLGANVTVLAGVTIGNDTVVAAGSVVVRDLPAGVMAAGAPATVRREVLGS